MVQLYTKSSPFWITQTQKTGICWRCLQTYPYWDLPNQVFICHVQHLTWSKIQVLGIPEPFFHSVLFSSILFSSFLFSFFIFIFFIFISFISLLAAFNYSVNGSICLKWQYASLTFLFNSPNNVSFALLHIFAKVTLSCKKRRDSVPWFSLWSFIWNKHDQQNLVAKIYAHIWPFLYTVVVNNVSLNTLCGYLLYHNWWKFILNCLDKDGCNTVQTTCFVVMQTKVGAFLAEIPLILARSKWSSPTDFAVMTCAIQKKVMYWQNFPAQWHSSCHL